MWVAAYFESLSQLEVSDRKTFKKSEKISVTKWWLAAWCCFQIIQNCRGENRKYYLSLKHVLNSHGCPFASGEDIESWNFNTYIKSKSPGSHHSLEQNQRYGVLSTLQSYFKVMEVLAWLVQIKVHLDPGAWFSNITYLDSPPFSSLFTLIFVSPEQFCVSLLFINSD